MGAACARRADSGEVESTDVLGAGSPRAFAVTVKHPEEGRTLVESMLVRALGSLEGLYRAVGDRVGYKVGTLFAEVTSTGPTRGCTAVPTLVPVRRDSVLTVRSLRLKHHGVLYCHEGRVVHMVRCARCTRAPCLGVRHHVRGSAVDVCEDCAPLCPPAIQSRLVSIFVPSLVRDGTYATHCIGLDLDDAGRRAGWPKHPMDSRAIVMWLTSVDGPYDSLREMERDVEDGAFAFKAPFQPGVVWIWPARGAVVGPVPRWPARSERCHKAVL